MCKYCEANVRLLAGYYCNERYGEAEEYLCENTYEYCRIAYKDGCYCIKLSGMGEMFSHPISYCPFCGKKLNE